MDPINFKKNFVPVFSFYEIWLRTVFQRQGGDPYPPYYRFCTNEEVGTSTAYIGFPVFPGMWNNGRDFVKWFAKRESAYELILNTAPEVYTYMREESRMPLNCLIVGHANCGHSHFFKHNRFCNAVGAETIMQRMANWADRFAQLEADPEFGIERLEYTADAALVLAPFCRESSEDKISNLKLRARLEGELRRMQSDRRRAAGGFEAEILDRRIKLLQERLKRDPINRVRDIGSFILDPEQNPGLSDKEREVIEIVFAVKRYFQPQGWTKFMNEGFAEFTRMTLLDDPQACVPPNWRKYLATHFDGAFEGNPTNRYTSPYWFSRYIYQREAKKHCPVRGEIEVPIPVFKKVPNPESDANRLKKLDKGETVGDADFEPNADPTSWMIDDDGDMLVFTGDYRLIKVPDQDLMHIFQIVKNHSDFTFFHTFLDDETLQEIHDTTLRWIKERFQQISHDLRKYGWNPALVARPIPKTLEGQLQHVQMWLTAQAEATQTNGPPFPVLQLELEWMGEMLMLIMGYHEDKRLFRQQHIAFLTLSGDPDISLIDGGVDSANGRTLVIEHLYDPVTGQLRESWARKALERIPRLWKQGGVKLITRKSEYDQTTGQVTGSFPFEYEVNAQGELSERRITTG